MSKRLTTEEFVIKAKKVHGDTYLYDKTVYIKAGLKVTITCPIHGDFEQQTNNHLTGHGCDKCARFKQKTSPEEFISKAKRVHNNKYNYNDVRYINSYTKILIYCDVHGGFYQEPSIHLLGHGCPKCSKDKNTYTKDVFISKAIEVHGDKYDYSLVEYTGIKNKIKIICPIHGMFYQNPGNHLFGAGCNDCGNESISHTKETFILSSKSIHGDKYDYSLVDYKNNKTKVKIICPIHGTFEQKPNSHMNGNGCGKCFGSVSKQEESLLEYIRIIYDGNIITNTRSIIKPYELDIYLPDKNIAFEYNGDYWHKEGVTKPVGYHKMKSDMCHDKGIYLYHIWESDWLNNTKNIQDNIRKKVEV